jgi:hypothetical protein
LLKGPSNGCVQHLLPLKPDEDILKWLKGFDRTTGNWNRDRCEDYYVPFPY